MTELRATTSSMSRPMVRIVVSLSGEAEAAAAIDSTIVVCIRSGNTADSDDCDRDVADENECEV